MRNAGSSWLAVAIALAMLLLGGCGGSEKAGAASPNDRRGDQVKIAGSARGGVTKKADAPDQDSDGIRDQTDRAPAEESGAAPGPSFRNQLAAPSTPASATEGKPEAAPRAGGNEAPHDTALLVYTARVTLAVYQVEQGLAAVEKIAKEAGGYLSQKRDREITIRVPRLRFEATLAAVDKIGDVLHRDIQAQDVTDEYVDTEIRIKNARAMQVRLKALLEKAPVKEALEIEKEMRRVTDEIELLEGKLKLLKDKIAYSTVTVAFEPRGSSMQATKVRLPFPWLSSLGLPALLRLAEDR